MIVRSYVIILIKIIIMDVEFRCCIHTDVVECIKCLAINRYAVTNALVIICHHIIRRKKAATLFFLWVKKRTTTNFIQDFIDPYKNLSLSISFRFLRLCSRAWKAKQPRIGSLLAKFNFIYLLNVHW